MIVVSKKNESTKFQFLSRCCFLTADNLRAKCLETIQHYYSEAFDNGTVGRVEILPISLNSVDVMKMKETNATIEAAPSGNSELMKSSTYQNVIMKTAFYCNQEFYQVRIEFSSLAFF